MNLIDTLRAQYGDKNVTVKTVRPNGSICGSEPKEISPKTAIPGEKVVRITKGESVGYTRVQ